MEEERGAVRETRHEVQGEECWERRSERNEGREPERVTKEENQ